MHYIPTFLIGLSVLLHAVPAGAESRSLPVKCSYIIQIWNVHEKRSLISKKVEHAYALLRPEEIDQRTGCTVCSEDQEQIEIAPLPAFSVCRMIAPQVRGSLERLLRDNAAISSVTGYHVVKSRGPLDASGNRTQLSNHSFGTAIDINPEQNGLYDNCITFGPSCRLLRGGAWSPGSLGSIEKNGDIVRMLKSAGFRWGGEIAGRQKDFMHFSLTGY
jgi:hypothetical protein